MIKKSCFLYYPPPRKIFDWYRLEKRKDYEPKNTVFRFYEPTAFNDFLSGESIVRDQPNVKTRFVAIDVIFSGSSAESWQWLFYFWDLFQISRPESLHVRDPWVVQTGVDYMWGWQLYRHRHSIWTLKITLGQFYRLRKALKCYHGGVPRASLHQKEPRPLFRQRGFVVPWLPYVTPSLLMPMICLAVPRDWVLVCLWRKPWPLFSKAGRQQRRLFLVMRSFIHCHTCPTRSYSTAKSATDEHILQLTGHVNIQHDATL